MRCIYESIISPTPSWKFNFSQLRLQSLKVVVCVYLVPTFPTMQLFLWQHCAALHCSLSSGGGEEDWVLSFWVNCSFKKFLQMDLLIFDDLIAARKPESLFRFSVLLNIKIRNHGDAAGGWNIVGRQQKQQGLTLAPLQNLMMKNWRNIFNFYLDANSS